MSALIVRSCLLCTILSKTLVKSDNNMFYSYPLIYTTESKSLSGKWCLNDCVDGKCVVDIGIVEDCRRSKDPAATFYTTRQTYGDQKKCSSRCMVLRGDSHNRCFVDYDWYKLDYCNPEVSGSLEYRDFTEAHGPCVNDCRPLTKVGAYVTGKCNDISGALRSCYVDKMLYESVKTINGKKCNGMCLQHQGKPYFWCMHSLSDWDYCAPPAIYHTKCHKCKPQFGRQAKETVFKYADRMERDPSLRTVPVSDPNNPIYSYTYNETRTSNGVVRLPLVVRARVYPSHVRPSNTRGNNAISPDARTNCDRMGMTGFDAVGHLISYKMGGPADFYNFVPMTQEINIGRVTGGNVFAPSVWAATEREDANFVEREGGQLNIVVVLQYDFNHLSYPYRPQRIGWGQIGHSASGDEELTCPNYWYNNAADADDPECFD